jgi:hypothetical protein
MLSLGTQRWPCRKSQDARRADNRGVARSVPILSFGQLRVRLFSRSQGVTRLGGAQRFAVRRHAKALLQLGGATVHKAGSDDGMPLELRSQSFQKSVALSDVDRRCGGLDRGEFVI